MPISGNIDFGVNSVDFSLIDTNDYIIDDNANIIYRKYKMYSKCDTSNLSDSNPIHLSQKGTNGGFFRTYQISEYFFINNIRGTQITGSDDNYYYTPIDGSALTINTHNGMLYMTIDTGALAASKLIIEADFWFGWTIGTEDAFENTYDVGSILNKNILEKTINDEELQESYFPILTNKQKIEMKGIENSNAFTYLDDDGGVINNANMFRKYIPYTKVEIAITSDDAQKTYDGTPLTKHTYTTNYNGSDPEILADLDKITLDFTGSQTNVGSSNNSFAINWNGVNREKYEISMHYGTLTVTSPGGSDAPPAPTP